MAADIQSLDFNLSDGISLSGDWRTVLVTGLGQGGSAYFALDITDGTMADGVDTFLWEFTDVELGLATADAYIDPIRSSDQEHPNWVVLLSSGKLDNDRISLRSSHTCLPWRPIQVTLNG